MIQIKVIPPHFRDEAQFQALLKQVKDAKMSDDMIKLLIQEVPKDPRVFSSKQIIALFNAVSFTDKKLQVMEIVKDFVYEFDSDEVVSLLKNISFSQEKLKLLVVLAEFLSDVTEPSKEKIIAHFSFSSDKDEARKILNNIKKRNPIYGRVKDKVCIFVVDISPSMGWTFQALDGKQVKRLDFVKQQLSETLSVQLEPYQAFNIIIFGGSAKQWKNDVVPANPQNIKEAITFISQLGEINATNISEALDLALKTSSHLEAIYLLSDGAPTGGISKEEEMAKHLQASIQARVAKNLPKLLIHVTSLQLGGKETKTEKDNAFKMLKTIAEATKGSFRDFQ